MILSSLFIFSQLVFAERTVSSDTSCFDDAGTRTCTTSYYSGPFNYYNGIDYVPVDMNLISSADVNYQYENNDGYYDIYFKVDPTEGQVVKFIKNGIEITFQPMALNYRNDLNQLEQISMIQSVAGIPYSNKFLYANAYGSGIDLSYTYYQDLLKEGLVIESQLSDPAEYIISGGNPTLDLDFVLTTNAQHIEIEGTDWDKSSTEQTQNGVDIVNELGQTIYTLQQPYAIDADGDRQLLTYEFKQTASKLYVVIKAPYSWLSTASYPVEIDPSIFLDSNITDILADVAVKEDAPNTNYGTETVLLIQKFSGFQHDFYIDVNISTLPTGATIDSTVITLYTVSVNDNDIAVHHLLNNYTYDEHTVTWNSGRAVAGDFNATREDNLTVSVADTYYTWNITNATKVCWNQGLDVCSYYFQATNGNNIQFGSREGTLGVERRPRVNITYSFDIPVVTLNEPTNETELWFKDSPFIFNFSVVADDIMNATLYGNFSGTFIRNQTNSSAVSISTNYSFDSINIGRGSYAWNVLVCDREGDCAWADNFTLNINNSLPTLKTDISFTNYSVGHMFNLTATFTDLDGASDIVSRSIDNTSGQCDYVSNSTSGNDITIVYNCTGTALTTTTVQINVTDVWGDKINSSPNTNAFPNNAPTMTGADLNQTSGVVDLDDLQCDATGASDLDGDGTTYHYEWYNDTVAVGLDSITLLNGNTTAGETWYCEAWVTDSYENSSKYTSTSVAIDISEVAPTISNTNATTEDTGVNSTSANPTNNNSWVNMSVHFSDTDTENWTAYFCNTPTWANCLANTSGAQFCRSNVNSTSKTLSCIYNVTGYTGTNPRTFYVFVLDNASRQSAPMSSSFEINHQPTIPTLASPSSGTYTSNTWMFINFTSTDWDSDTINYSIHNSTGSSWSRVNYTTQSWFNWSSLTDGIYYIRAYATDEHNYSSSNSTDYNFTVDTTLPNLIVSSPEHSATYYNTNIITLTISANDTNLLVCNYTYSYKALPTVVVGRNTANCVGNTLITLPGYNDYVLNVYSYDAAYNENSTQLNFTTATQQPDTGGGGGTTTIIESTTPTKEEIAGLCGNGLCEAESGETPWTCPQDCLTKTWEFDQIFCMPLFDCGNWKESWFINIMMFVVFAGVVYTQVRKKKVGGRFKWTTR